MERGQSFVAWIIRTNKDTKSPHLSVSHLWKCLKNVQNKPKKLFCVECFSFCSLHRIGRHVGITCTSYIKSFSWSGGYFSLSIVFIFNSIQYDFTLLTQARSSSLFQMLTSRKLKSISFPVTAAQTLLKPNRRKRWLDAKDNIPVSNLGGNANHWGGQKVKPLIFSENFSAAATAYEIHKK